MTPERAAALQAAYAERRRAYAEGGEHPDPETPAEMLPMAIVKPEWISAAKAACAGTVIPPCVVVAQFILESGWGSKTPPGSNNFFGEKAMPGQAGVTTKTEEDNGGAHTIEATFLAFPSLEAAFAYHVRHLNTSAHYAKAKALLPDVNAYLRAMGATYSTSQVYADTLIGIIDIHGLRII